jgi:hypothetical protein
MARTHQAETTFFIASKSYCHLPPAATPAANRRSYLQELVKPRQLLSPQQKLLPSATGGYAGSHFFWSRDTHQLETIANGNSYGIQ